MTNRNLIRSSVASMQVIFHWHLLHITHGKLFLNEAKGVSNVNMFNLIKLILIYYVQAHVPTR